MAQVMSIDSEAVGSAINQISVCIADIDTRNKKFIALLQEKNEKTQGKFALLKTLEARVAEEADNFTQLIATAESIKDSLRRYEGMAEEANDDSDFRV